MWVGEDRRRRRLHCVGQTEQRNGQTWFLSFSVCLLSFLFRWFFRSFSFVSLSLLFSLSSLLFAQVQRESIYVGRCKGRTDKGGGIWLMKGEGINCWVVIIPSGGRKLNNEITRWALAIEKAGFRGYGGGVAQTDRRLTRC